MTRLCLLNLVCGLALFAASPHDIEGRVLDANTGAPVVRARVTVTLHPPVGDAVPVSMLTDGSGVFRLKNAPEGNYDVICERAGYLAGSLSSGDATAAGSSPAIVRLVPQVVIEGSVVDEKDAAVPFADVQVFCQTVIEGRRQPLMASSTETDNKGSFRIFGLGAGRYWVGVSVLQRSQLAKSAYPPVFYPNSPDINGAELMDLKSGQERHLRIRLQEPVPTREIRGEIVPAGEAPDMELLPADGAALHHSGIKTDWDEKSKTFKISGVTAGIYVLQVSTTVGNQPLGAAMTITVGQTDLAGLRVEPRTPPAVFGTVRMEGKENLATSVPLIVFRSRRGPTRMQLDAAGDFKSQEWPADTYRLVSPDGPFYLRSAWQGGRDVLRDGLVVAGDSAPAPLEILLGGPGATVEGSLDLGDSSEPGNVIVALLRQAGSEMVLEKQAYVNRSLPAGAAIVAGQATRAGNRFTIRGVAPGDYVLFCWPADSPAPYADPGFFEQYRTLGKAITVNGTETISVTLDRMVPRIDP